MCQTAKHSALGAAQKQPWLSNGSGPRLGMDAITRQNLRSGLTQAIHSSPRLPAQGRAAMLG